MPSPTLKQRFQLWNSDTTKSHIKADDYPTTLEGSRRMLDDSLWRAYEEGYKQCQADIKAALKKMG
jgi:hypothetical protein